MGVLGRSRWGHLLKVRVTAAKMEAGGWGVQVVNGAKGGSPSEGPQSQSNLDVRWEEEVKCGGFRNRALREVGGGNDAVS